MTKREELARALAIRLSIRHAAFAAPDVVQDGTFFVSGGGWAWLRRVKRYRGLFLSGPCYMELEP